MGKNQELKKRIKQLEKKVAELEQTTQPEVIIEIISKQINLTLRTP